MKKNKSIAIFYLVVIVATLLIIADNKMNNREADKPYLNETEVKLTNDR